MWCDSGIPDAVSTGEVKKSRRSKYIGQHRATIFRRRAGWSTGGEGEHTFRLGGFQSVDARIQMSRSIESKPDLYPTDFDLKVFFSVPMVI